MEPPSTPAMIIGPSPRTLNPNPWSCNLRRLANRGRFHLCFAENKVNGPSPRNKSSTGCWPKSGWPNDSCNLVDAIYISNYPQKKKQTDNKNRWIIIIIITQLNHNELTTIHPPPLKIQDINRNQEQTYSSLSLSLSHTPYQCPMKPTIYQETRLYNTHNWLQPLLLLSIHLFSWLSIIIRISFLYIKR